MSRSQGTVNGDRIPPSQRSYNERPRRERPNESIHGHHGGYQPERERRDKRSQERLSSQAPIQYHHSRAASDNQSRYSKASHPPYSSPNHRSASGHQTFSQKCSNLCSRRGVLQFVEITSGILVLICVVASYAVITGYTSAAGFGSFSIDSMYSPFEGSELQQVRDADLQYSQLRAPGVYGGVAYSLAICALTIVFLIVGAKPIHRASIKLVFVELIFDSIACIGYIVAVGLYLYFIKKVNATDTCKTRERLYAGRGYTWMNCEVQGGDAAVAIFGLIAGCLYLSSCIMCILYIRAIREFRRDHMTHEYPASAYSDNQHRPKKYRDVDQEETVFQPSTLV
ncbi:MARVEL domain-containing protein 3-like isoform X2 [Hyperolius riggenbachi]|uniref:MARVEL domain-containing protein 3-like isoform X2 n=1 Tax=Hyperolius riggenbachi TaxID=752182 RepID=UPI0035A2F8D3